MLERIKEIIGQVPKPVLIGAGLLVIVLVFFLWKKFSSKDRENEVVRGAEQAALFAENVQRGLDKEDAPMMSALTPEYANEVQTGLTDLEETTPVVSATTKEEEEESDSDLEDYE